MRYKPLAVILLASALVVGLSTQLWAGNEKSWDDLNEVMVEQINQAKYTEAISTAQQALTIARESFGLEHMKTAISLQQLANLYRKQQKEDQADILTEEALLIWDKTLGSEKELSFQMRIRFAHSLEDRGEYPKALAALTDLVREQEKYFGSSHTALASSLEFMADILWKQEAFDKAFALQERSVQMYAEILDAEDSRLIPAHQRLANRYFDQSLYGKALIQNKEVLNLANQIYTKQDSRMAQYYLQIAENHEKLYNYYPAEENFKLGLESLRGAYIEQTNATTLGDLKYALYRLKEFFISRGRQTDADRYGREADELNVSL
ncbi:MAG: hypothetical protein ACI9CF_001790 [Candidatus Omnitrophota bacterium]